MTQSNDQGLASLIMHVSGITHCWIWSFNGICGQFEQYYQTYPSIFEFDQ